MPAARQRATDPLHIFSGLGREFDLLCYIVVKNGKATIPTFVAEHQISDDVARVYLGRLIRAGYVEQAGCDHLPLTNRSLKTYRPTQHALRCLEATRQHHADRAARLSDVLAK